MKQDARFWKVLDHGRNKVVCLLCPRECVVAAGKGGFCRVRANEEGSLYSVGYGETVSLAMDPIEKKPLYHFYPGSNILSVGCNGCNLACIFCQNWQISQSDVPTRYIPPDKLLGMCLDYNSVGVAFTYSEPLIWFEYIVDVAEEAKTKGLKVVLVTNGIINREPLEELLPYVDAMNVDLKSMRHDFYKRLCLGDFLDTVLNTIKRVHESGTWIEVTNLIIPGHNDSREDIRELIDWLASISPDIPLHFSRFFPHYRLTDVPPTPVSTLAMAREMALGKMKFVYVGNVWKRGWDCTYCPDCGRVLIEREGYLQVINHIGHVGDGCCPGCGEFIPVIT